MTDHEVGPEERLQGGCDPAATSGADPDSTVAVTASEQPPTGPLPTVVPAPRPAPAFQVPPEPDGWPGSFEDFFRAHYRTLLRQARYAGANEHEADDAAAAIMMDVYRHWNRLDDPLAWARRAVGRSFIKRKVRSLDRIRARQVRFHAGTPLARADANMTSWEEWQWIQELLLNWLTVDQRDVMALTLDGFAPAEVADEIGAPRDAVRQRLRLARKALTQAWRQYNDVEPGGNNMEGTT